MERLNEKYEAKISSYSDIYEHLPTLYKYAKECNTIVECGVRYVVSSWAFLKGLNENGSDNKLNTLISVDLEKHDNVDELEEIANECGINFRFIEGNDIKVDIPNCDIIFIDTYHVYGHLKRELNKFKDVVNKYIIMHDTQVDENEGETIRCGFNILEMVRTTGYDVEELLTGLKPAIKEFLNENPNFRIKEVFMNNNGLTILEKID